MKQFVKIIFCFVILSFSLIRIGHSQTFLNGDFEINTAGVDQINLSNPAFNGFMSNTIAYGSFGDMDIITSGTYCGLAQNGLWYTALTGSSTDAITMQLSAPLVAGTSYTITFWDKGCWPTYSASAPPVQLGVSAVAGAVGTAVYTAPTPTNGVWVQRTATFIAPIGGLYISVELPSGGLGDWTQIDNFTFVSTTPTPPVTNFSASDNTICEADCISFTDLSTNTPTSWSWTFAGGTPSTSTVQNPSSICYATAGTYAVTLTSTNASGADTLTQTTFITVDPIDVAAFNYTPSSFCQSGTNPTPTITGTAGGTFTSTAGLSITGSTGTINLMASTPGTYTVTYTTAGACPATATASVTISTTSLATFNYAGPYCQNAVDPSPTFGAGATAGTFTSSAGLSINASTGVVDLSASTPGTYTVTNDIPASGSCPAASDTATITINAVPAPAIIGNSPICSGASSTLTATGGTTYSWNTGATSASIVVSPLVTTTYTVTANNGGCTATTTMTVVVNPPTTTNASATICQGNSYSLPSGTSVTSSGVYNDTLSNSLGCDSIVVTTLTVTPAPVGTINAVICSGQNYTLPSGAIVGNPGMYSDTVSAGGGCDSIINVNLSVISAIAFAGLDDIIDYGSSTTLLASGGVSYSWSPATGLSSVSTASTVASPLQTTSYTVTVTNANGCTASDVVTVFVDLPPCDAAAVDLKTLIPNAFSPNDDGVNDGLCIPKNPCIVKLTLMIYDRWGEKVYESSSLDQCWDGLLRGKKLDPAVFAYYFTVVFVDNTKGEGKGNISLIR